EAYSQGNPHNLNFYVRPEDNKVLAFPWDWDFAFRQSTSAPLHGNRNIGDVLNRPVYQRLLYGHMLQIINTAFNTEYMNRWLSHYGTMLGRSFSYSGNIANRSTFVTNGINSAIPPVDFRITTNSGNPITVNDDSVTIAGDGWVDVREIRLEGSQAALDVTWTDNNSWRITLPVAFGPNNLQFEAYDFEGNLTGSDSITVTSTDPDQRVADIFRLGEVMYDPADPTADEEAAGFDNNDDFEFIELVNTSNATIDLRGVEFSRGVTFGFTGSGFESLGAGERVVVVRNLDAFNMRYADTLDAINVAGAYEGKLVNGGEGLALVDGNGQVAFDFEYDNDWYDITAGDGFSLTVRDVNADPATLVRRSAWQPSSLVDGTPGLDDFGPRLGSVVINEILTHTDNSLTGDWIELYNTTAQAINIGGWYLSDSGNLRKFRIPDGTMIAGGGYLTFDQFGAGGFGVNSLLVNPLGNPGAFGLSELGDVLRLSSVDPAQIRENIDAIHVIDENRIIFSTAGSAVLGTNAMSFRDGDLVEYNTTTRIASLFFSESIFRDPTGLLPVGENIDAISMLSNGDLVLSTAGSARLGALPFRDGDLVRFNPTTGVATLLLSEDIFDGGGDINAVHVFESNGVIDRYVISTDGPVTIAGVLYDDGDLIEIDAGNLTASLFLSENIFEASSISSIVTENIDAVYLGAAGQIVLSTNSAATLVDLAFSLVNGDLVELQPGGAADLPGGDLGAGATARFLFEEDPADGSITFYGEAAGYREDVDFAAAASEVTFGLYHTSDGQTDFVALVAPTKGGENSAPRVGPIVFNEVMYSPTDGGPEFIELLNISGGPIDLSGWTFTAGITFTFPPLTPLVPPGGLAMVVPADFDIFVPAGVPVGGPYEGVLADGGEKLELSRPGVPELDGTIPLIEVVRLAYDDLSPWPEKAAGQGWSLQLKQTDQYGNDPINWGTTIPGGTAGDFVVAPRVAEVLVWGSGWSPALLDRLEGDGHGASIPAGLDQFEPVAWTGVDRLSIRFTEDVRVESDHLDLLGVNVTEYDVVDFQYDAASFTATWSLGQTLRADHLRLVLSGQVRDPSGLPLDGDWTDGAGTFPSGNGAIDSNDDFRFRFNVLAGDAVPDIALPGDEEFSRIDRRDLIEVIHHLGGSAADDPYDPRMDTNAAGQIDTNDWRAILLRQGTRLPTGEPHSVSVGAPLHEAIQQTSGFSRVYQDDAYSLFARDGIDLPIQDNRGVKLLGTFP
ncbi:MAG: lamin tail domain-containing protein, partial [Planctomycetes bacterium]|nr:lamin tail domain-containing protein [Planctomycetota bacterium]